MCFGLDILGLNSGAKAQAAATEKAAQNQKLVAQGQQLQTESTLAQDKAAEAAKAMLNVPAETTSVNVGDQTPAATTDANGNRKTIRSTFQLATAGGTASGSGLSI
jgi:hypothetical protein